MIFILLRKRNNCHNTRKCLFLYTFVDRQIRLITFTINVYNHSHGFCIHQGRNGTVTLYWRGKGTFSSRKVQRGSEGRPGLILPEVQRSGHEADHSPACGAEVSNEWHHIFAPPSSLQDVYRDNFNRTLKELYELVYISQDRLEDSHLPKTIT